MRSRTPPRRSIDVSSAVSREVVTEEAAFFQPVQLIGMAYRMNKRVGLKVLSCHGIVDGLVGQPVQGSDEHLKLLCGAAEIFGLLPGEVLLGEDVAIGAYEFHFLRPASTCVAHVCQFGKDCSAQGAVLAVGISGLVPEHSHGQVVHAGRFIPGAEHVHFQLLQETCEVLIDELTSANLGADQRGFLTPSLEAMVSTQI